LLQRTSLVTVGISGFPLAINKAKSIHEHLSTRWKFVMLCELNGMLSLVEPTLEEVTASVSHRDLHVFQGR